MKSKPTLLIAFILVAILGFFLAYYFFSSAKVRNTPSAGVTIVALGDSLVYGVGSTEGNDFVSLVSKKIGRPIINMGVPGDTTADGLARLDDVLALNPDTVIVLLGGNDYLKRVDRTETFTNLDQIVTRLQNSGTAVLLLGVRGGAIRDTYESDFADFAKAHEVAYVSNVLDGLLGDRELMFDQIHPNDRGYAVIADRVAPVLLKMFTR